MLVCTPRPSLSYYAFFCPDCHNESRWPAPACVISLLLSAGVHATLWDLPAEALEPHVGPPLTCDDLLDLALALQSTSDICAMAAGESVKKENA